jgi:hypothetical protein
MSGGMDTASWSNPAHQPALKNQQQNQEGMLNLKT